MRFPKKVVLIYLIIYVPSTIFLGWTSTKLGLMCLAQGQNPVTLVRLKPAALQPRVKHSTTEPLRTLQWCGILTCVDSDNPVQPPFKLRNSKWCSVRTLRVIEYFQQLAKALIRLRVCAGWSKPLLIAHTTLLEISCRDWIIICW